MKSKYIALLVALTTVAFAAGNIRWNATNNKPLLEIRSGGTNVIQFGLRDDGVVVWREINTSTNSPAEAPSGIWIRWGNSATNYIIQ